MTEKASFRGTFSSIFEKVRLFDYPVSILRCLIFCNRELSDSLLAKNIYPFVRKQMGEDGLKKFERAEVEALIKKNASPALLLLKCIRLFSPSTAFAMTCKQMGYQFQWITPFSVPELTQHKAVLDIPRCKILDFPDTDDMCLLGCQSTYPMWVAEQFKVSMKWNRQGNSCTGSLAPLM